MTGLNTRIDQTPKMTEARLEDTDYDEVAEFIEATVRTQQTEDIRQYSTDEADSVLAVLRARFLERENARAFWLGLDPRLTRTVRSYDPSRREGELARFAPCGLTDRVRLIIESNSTRVPVFEGSFESILVVLGDCYTFEFVIAPLSSEWILADTDHSEHILVTAESRGSSAGD